MNTAASVITRSTTSTHSIVKMSRREKSDHRRKKLRRNLITLVVTRCLQGRSNLPVPDSSQLADLEDQVDSYLDTEKVSDAVVNTLAMSLRKVLVAQAPRSVTAPPPDTEQQSYVYFIITDSNHK